jgi:hypothetical protein
MMSMFYVILFRFYFKIHSLLPVSLLILHPFEILFLLVSSNNSDSVTFCMNLPIVTFLILSTIYLNQYKSPILHFRRFFCDYFVADFLFSLESLRVMYLTDGEVPSA